MKFIILTVVVFISAVASAKTCFKNEKNFRTGTNFTSATEYSEELQRWKMKEPEMPFFGLFRAYKLYLVEEAYVKTLKSDKVAHCFLGCRIAQRIDYSTANYVGWLKENIDLTDCKSYTRFDVEDYDATIRGGQMGENKATDCIRACWQVYR